MTEPNTPQVSSLREVVRNAEKSVAESDLGRWLTNGSRLLQQTRQRLAAAEHGHSVGRARIIADAERELAAFRQATRDKLADFDSEQQQLIRELREEVERIEHMQDAGQP